MIRTRFLLNTAASGANFSNAFVNLSVLQTYKRIKGNLTIPRSYVVGETPDDAKLWPSHYLGFKLGSYAQFISTGIENGLYSSSVLESLQTMGFRPGSSAYSKNNDILVSAAAAYVKIYGHGKVPSAFKVPANSRDWPAETWDLPLGTILSIMRNNQSHYASSRQRLIDMGISFEARSQRHNYDLCVNAIKTYKELNNTVQVPRDFVIDVNDVRYDPGVRGTKLGQWLSVIRRNQESWPEYKTQLEELGVDFTIKGKRQAIPFTAIYSALCTYISIHGHLNIPVSYRVNFQDSFYSEEVWGFGLGRALQYIKSGGHSRHRNIIAKLRLQKESEKTKTENMSFQMLYDALVVFKMIHGHLDVVNTYVVPLDDDRYPEGVRGAKLGLAVRYVRLNEVKQKNREVLKSLGMVMNKGVVTNDFDKVYACLVTYKEIHKHLYVPFSFKVPANDNRYPEGSQKFSLGRVVGNIRLNGCHSEHRGKLKALGFAFVDAYIRNVVTALRVYKRLHGDLKIPYEYVVSSDDTAYPEETRGLGLGVIVSTFRQGRLRQEYASGLEREASEFKEEILVKGSRSNNNC